MDDSLKVEFGNCVRCMHLANAGPQAWHPASDEQKTLCRKAENICKEANVELGKSAMYHFMQLDGAATFLAGMQTHKLLEINLSAFYNGLSKQEQEVLQLLRETTIRSTSMKLGTNILFGRVFDWKNGTGIGREGVALPNENCVFTKSINWEGRELELYWAAMNKKN